MRWLPLLSVFIGLSVDSGRLLSQEASVEDSPGQAQASLLRDSDRVRFDLVMGRLEIDPVRYRKGTVHASARSQEGGEPFSEALSIEAWRGLPRVHYTRRSETLHWTLDVDQTGKVVLSADTLSGARRVSLSQPRGGPLTLRLETDQRRVEEQFGTWLHLYMAQTPLYQQHFAGLVDDLLYPIRLGELAERAHADSLARIVSSEWSTDTPYPTRERGDERRIDARLDDQELATWVGQLGSASRRERATAQETLRRQGVSLLSRLRRWDDAGLDAEQRARFAELRRQLTPPGGDCSARLATLIMEDPDYWIAASTRLSETERTRIAQRLKQTLRFDPPDVVRVAKPPQVDSGTHTR